MGVLVGCNPQSPILTDLFVPLPPSTEVKNAPRHPPPLKQVQIVIVQAEVIKPPDVDWSGIYQALPRDSKGAVDWMRALDEKTITPRPGIDPAAEAASTTDSEIVFTPADNPGKAATFRHATHTQWLGCKNTGKVRQLGIFETFLLCLLFYFLSNCFSIIIVQFEVELSRKLMKD